MKWEPTAEDGGADHGGTGGKERVGLGTTEPVPTIGSGELPSACFGAHFGFGSGGPKGPPWLGFGCTIQLPDAMRSETEGEVSGITLPSAHGLGNIALPAPAVACTPGTVVIGVGGGGPPGE